MKPRRPIFALPPGINLNDYLFEPDAEEVAATRRMKRRRYRHKQFTKRVEEMGRKFEREELEYLRRKCEALVGVVEADRAWIARQNQFEAELKRVQDYYAQEHAKEEAAADKARRGKCLRLGKEIYRDTARAERGLLVARGMVRGRRK